MKFKKFMSMYDNWNGYVTVNDNNLKRIVHGVAHRIMDCNENFDEDTKVENYKQLFNMEVVSFGFYDEELCVRVK